MQASIQTVHEQSPSSEAILAAAANQHISKICPDMQVVKLCHIDPMDSLLRSTHATSDPINVGLGLLKVHLKEQMYTFADYVGRSPVKGPSGI